MMESIIKILNYIKSVNYHFDKFLSASACIIFSTLIISEKCTAS